MNGVSSFVAPKRIAAEALSVNRRFGRYKHEEKKVERKAEVQECEALKRIVDAWEEFNSQGRIWSGGFSAMLRITRSLSYTARDVEAFSLVLVESQHGEDFPQRAGHFLSALIDSGEESSYIIRTGHLTALPERIGFRNRKDVTIDGDAGDLVGCWMENGSIRIKGDAGDQVGYRMEGGSITVEGDVGHSVGQEMAGGNIFVEGDASALIGLFMEGGEIHLEGGYEELSGQLAGGRIIHKGKLIADK